MALLGIRKDVAVRRVRPADVEATIDSRSAWLRVSDAHAGGRVSPGCDLHADALTQIFQAFASKIGDRPL